MGNNSGSLRRTLGIVCLAVPVGMLVLGQTALKSSLANQVALFLVYWLVCFLFTFAAMFLALAEIRAIRRQTQEETRDLIAQTLNEAEQAQKKPPDRRNAAER